MKKFLALFLLLSGLASAQVSGPYIYSTGGGGGGGSGTGPTTNPVSPAEGGTGDNTSAVTGVPFINGGNWTYAAGIANLAASTSANLASVLSDETGTNKAVFSDSPTIVTPTIASHANAQHDHSNAAGGGNIPESSVTNLTTDLSAKAVDSAVVHNTGTETVAGAKTFSTVPVLGTLAGILKGTAGAISAGAATIADLASSTSANLASVLSDETGTNKAVFSDSPTIVTPTIASFTNATHNHSNAAGGGNITEAAVTNLTTDLAAKSASFTDSAGLAGLLSDETGSSGGFVRAGSPTLTTPIIASLTNVQHDHSNAAGGGNIPEASVTNLVSDLAAKASTTTPLITGRATFGSAVDAANAVDIDEVAGQITFEGATADTIETRIAVADPTSGDQTWTIPNAAGVVSRTFASLEAGQTFSGNNTYSGTSIFGQISRLAADLGYYVGAGTTDATNSISTRTAGTPDATYLLAGSLGNSWHLAESADKAFDFNNGPCGTSACTDPTFITHSHNQATNEWISQTHDGTNAVIASGKGGLSLPAHKAGVGTAPTVSACGATPSTVTGSDGRGRLTTGSGGTVQSCTLTFAVAYAVAPSCVANDETSILAVRAVATTTTLVIDSAVAGTLASQVVNFICEGL